jgi:general secretion pathway protein A
MYTAAYTSHFGLKAAPFALSPDPDFLYLSSQHKQALEHLLQGVTAGNGLILLSGEVGTGKTILCCRLVEQLADGFDVVLLSNPCLSPQELLAAIFDKLHLHYDDSFTIKDFTDTLNNYLLTAYTVGRKTVLIIDEAQNLTFEVLEQIRLLSNIEDHLLRIVLVGQSELRHTIKQKNLRQLAQRITASFHLKPLTNSELSSYIQHRLTIAGAESEFFSKSAIRYIYRYTRGIARLTNVICDKALLNAYVANKNQVDIGLVRKAIHKTKVESPAHYSPWGWTSLILGIIVLFGGLIWWASYSQIITNQNPPGLPINTEILHTDIDNLTQDPFRSPLIPEIDNYVDDEVVIVENVADITEPSELTLLAVLQNRAIPSNTNAAFNSLFKLWNLDYNSISGNTACERALTQGLVCVYKTGKWQDIQNYNSPAVIELVDSNQQYHAVVTQLQGNLVTLNFAGRIFDFTREEINNFWLGQFLFLWRPPSIPVPVLRVGAVHDDVRWVRKRLNSIAGLNVPDAELSARFDEELRRLVIAFQRQNNLMVDGIIGEQTMLLLDAQSGLKPILD